MALPAPLIPSLFLGRLLDFCVVIMITSLIKEEIL